MSAGEPGERHAGAGSELGGVDIQAALSEEVALAASPRGRWHSSYLGRAYLAAVEAAVGRLASGPARVLKTDLWNECLGGDRDIAGHLEREDGCRVLAVDLAYPVCAGGRAQAPYAGVVQADIRALPFRSRSVDAVVDLSTLDHLPEAGAAAAIGEYRRVLRDSGVVLIFFWQRSVLLRVRLRLKSVFGRAEKPGQYYLSRGRVRAMLPADLAVADAFVGGLLLVPPFRLTSAVMRRVPAGCLARLLRWVVRLERSRLAHPLLKHVAGLYGIVAVRRPE